METLNGSTNTSQLKTEPDFISRFGRHLAHELNNPISAISSSVYLLEEFIRSSTDGTLSIEEAQPFIEGIHEECESLKHIVEEFSRYVTTNSVLESPIELTEFLRKRVEDMAREGMPVTFETQGSPVTILGDAGSLQTALRLLAQEAVESGASTVRFSLVARGDSEGSRDPLEIRMADDRKEQVSPDNTSAIFEPLGAGRPKHGLGLKLPLVKKIIALHKGSIERKYNTDGGAVTSIWMPKSA